MRRDWPIKTRAELSWDLVKCMVHVESWNGWGSSTHASHLESPQRVLMGSRFICAGCAHCGPCVFSGLSMLSAHRRRIEPQSPWLQLPILPPVCTVNFPTKTDLMIVKLREIFPANSIYSLSGPCRRSLSSKSELQASDKCSFIKIHLAFLGSIYFICYLRASDLCGQSFAGSDLNVITFSAL